MTDQRSNFEVIRDALLEMDPETRSAVIAAMKALQTVPRPVAARILANGAMRAYPRPSLLIATVT